MKTNKESYFLGIIAYYVLAVIVIFPYCTILSVILLRYIGIIDLLNKWTWGIIILVIFGVSYPVAIGLKALFQKYGTNSSRVGILFGVIFIGSWSVAFAILQVEKSNHELISSNVIFAIMYAAIIGITTLIYSQIRKQRKK